MDPYDWLQVLYYTGQLLITFISQNGLVIIGICIASYLTYLLKWVVSWLVCLPFRCLYWLFTSKRLHGLLLYILSSAITAGIGAVAVKWINKHEQSIVEHLPDAGVVITHLRNSTLLATVSDWIRPYLA